MYLSRGLGGVSGVEQPRDADADGDCQQQQAVIGGKTGGGDQRAGVTRQVLAEILKQTGELKKQILCKSMWVSSSSKISAS